MVARKLSARLDWFAAFVFGFPGIYNEFGVNTPKLGKWLLHDLKKFVLLVHAVGFPKRGCFDF